MPQFLSENKQIIKSLPSDSVIFKATGYKVWGEEKEKHKQYRNESFRSDNKKLKERQSLSDMILRTYEKTAILKLKPTH